MKFDPEAFDAAGISWKRFGNVLRGITPGGQPFSCNILERDILQLVPLRSAQHRALLAALKPPAATEESGEYRPSTYGS